MKQKIFLVVVILSLAVLFISTLPVWARRGRPVAAVQIPDRPVVVRIGYDTQEQVNSLASAYDIWEVHKDQKYLVAYLTPDEYELLTSIGYKISIDSTRSAYPDTIPGYSCAHTMDEVYTKLDQIVADHPQIASLETIGNSYQGRPLKVLHITNKNISGPKPVYFLMANIHGRELVTMEAALAFIDYLIGNYGTNADVSWVVDYQDIRVLVNANPDGHVMNEAGSPWPYWRKNLQNYGCSWPDSIGVDLNRNFAFKWSCCGGSDSSSCSETYHGPSAASEPETIAIQNYVLTLFPDQRGPGLTDAAPLDATGDLLTLHSYAGLVLWPWGSGYDQAPNAAWLQLLGTKLASYNGYTPEQASSLYITDGTTDDWSYGELGIASYTFEMGGPDFYPPCSQYPSLIDPNIPAMLYMAKVAKAPYALSQGPDAVDLSVLYNGDVYQVNASINDQNNGKHAISGAEFYLDIPPMAGGTPYSLQASDGTFDSSTEAVQGQFPASGWSMDRHTLYMRGRDASGQWGPLSAIYFQPVINSAIQGQVSAAGSSAAVPEAAIKFQGQPGTYNTTSRADGTYDLALPAGAYTASVSAFGFYSSTISGINALPGQDITQNFILTALPTGTITGTVREEGSLLPLAAQVMLAGTQLYSATNPETGVFTFTVPAGVYTVTVKSTGHSLASLANIQVLAGATTRLEIILPRSFWMILPLVIHQK